MNFFFLPISIFTFASTFFNSVISTSWFISTYAVRLVRCYIEEYNGWKEFPINNQGGWGLKIFGAQDINGRPNLVKTSKFEIKSMGELSYLKMPEEVVLTQ